MKIKEQKQRYFDYTSALTWKSCIIPSLTCRLHLCLDPEAQSCRSCTLRTLCSHAYVEQTPQSDQRIATTQITKEKLRSVSLKELFKLKMKLPITFQTENAKLISGTLTNVSSSSIKTAAQVKE